MMQYSFSSLNNAIVEIDAAIHQIKNDITNGSARVYRVAQEGVAFEGFTDSNAAVICDLLHARYDAMAECPITYPVNELEWGICDRLIAITEAQTPRTPGEIIKDARAHLDLSAYKLAQQVGCTAQNLYQIESGKSKPSVELAKSLAAVLHIDWQQLV